MSPGTSSTQSNLRRKSEQLTLARHAAELCFIRFNWNLSPRMSARVKSCWVSTWHWGWKYIAEELDWTICTRGFELAYFPSPQSKYTINLSGSCRRDWSLYSMETLSQSSGEGPTKEGMVSSHSNLARLLSKRYSLRTQSWKDALKACFTNFYFRVGSSIRYCRVCARCVGDPQIFKRYFGQYRAGIFAVGGKRTLHWCTLLLIFSDCLW